MKTNGELSDGWKTFDGVLTPRPEVAAYAARGQTVKGVCREKGCFRKVEISPRQLCGQGMGLIQMKKVQSLYRCSRLDGCGLQFHDEPLHPRLTLGMLMGKSHVRVRVRCAAGACKFLRVWTAEEIVASLAKKGKDGTGADIHTLGQLMTTPCKVCKKVNWNADVLWSDTTAMGWRQQGEAVFNKYKYGI